MSPAVIAAVSAVAGALLSQLVPWRRVRLDEFAAIRDELRQTIVGQGERIRVLEAEVSACERGRAEDRAATATQIAELALAFANATSRPVT